MPRLQPHDLKKGCDQVISATLELQGAGKHSIRHRPASTGNPAGLIPILLDLLPRPNDIFQQTKVVFQQMPSAPVKLVPECFPEKFLRVPAEPRTIQTDIPSLPWPVVDVFPVLSRRRHTLEHA